MINAEKPWLIQQDKDLAIKSLAKTVYQLVCRKEHSQPGFALIQQRHVQSSVEQRQLMCALKEALSEIYFSDNGEKLDWFNLNRFDQQNSTKPHRDGAPEESLLILGYEPSIVSCDLSMADYSKLSIEMGIEPNQFLEDHNPMYQEGKELLAPVTTHLIEFDPHYYQLVVVNNSSAPFNAANNNWQGVLHCATVKKLEGASRVINSTVVCPARYLSVEGSPDANKSTKALEREHWFLTSIDLQESTYQ